MVDKRDKNLKSLTEGLLIALALTLIPVSAFSAQKITPGNTCKVLNQKVTNQNKVYTCIKSGKKLVWNKGIALKKPTPTPTPTPTLINTNIVTDATKFIQSLINDTPITNTKNKTKIAMHVEPGKNGPYPAIAEEALSVALNFYASLGMALPQDSINVILGRTQGWMKEKADIYAPGCIGSTYVFDTSASLCAYPNRAAVSSRLPRAITSNGSAPDDIDLSNEAEILRFTNKKIVDSFAGAIPHEAHHAWQDGNYGNAGDVPKWLWEGGASLFGEMIYARLQSPNQSYLTFDPGLVGWGKSVCKGPIETMKPVCEYTQGIVVMEYFLYKLGVDSYVRLITQGNNVAFPVRFENATKVSLVSFYADVNKYLTLKGWNN